MNGGLEWLVEARGCRAAALRDPTLFERLADRIVSELDLRVLGRQVHAFPAPGGVTLLLLLAESHLCAHSYPEAGVATFNLYCCRPRPVWPWAERLREALGATQVLVRQVERG